MNSVILTVEQIPPSLNKMLRMHWAVKSKLQTDWDISIQCAIREQLRGPDGCVVSSVNQRIGLPYKKCEIELYYIFNSNRARDYDNYSGKFVLDALKHNYIIKDDNSKVVKKLSLVFADQAEKQEKLRIYIKEIK